MKRYKRKINPCKLKLKTKIKIFIVFLIAAMIILDSRLRPLIKVTIADRARAVAILAINTAVTKELSNSNIQYSDIAHIEKNDSGKIIGITTNVQKVNYLKSNISSAILKEISLTKMRKIGIPLGALFGIEVFGGAGPIIPVKIFVTGNVSTQFDSEFLEAGINQTKHLIYMNIQVNISAIVPGYPVTSTVQTNVTIAETIIVGDVPNVYATSKEANAKMREAKGLANIGK